MSPTVRYYSTNRVEGYTDGVFAIAATLLVLDLTTTALGDPASDDGMWTALWGMGDRFLAFGISFGLLSMLWVIHLQQWRDIARVDFVMLWINNARLLFVVLIPFTTSLVADYSAFYAGRMLLPLNFFFAALAGVLSWSWASSRNGHLVRQEDGAEAREQGLGGISALICGAVAAVVAPWIGSWGFLAYAFNVPLEALLRRRRDRRLSAKAPG
jgi:uncharacterized membrane protein